MSDVKIWGRQKYIEKSKEKNKAFMQLNLLWINTFLYIWFLKIKKVISNHVECVGNCIKEVGWERIKGLAKWKKGGRKQKEN